jgi:hypothetical protein
MTRHHDPIDASLETTLEAIAREAPPPGHLERVLATTGPLAGTVDRPHDVRVLLRPRWALPIAATLLLAGGLTWQLGRTGRPTLPPDAAATAPTHWGTPGDVDRPVLPPEMYWAMDPFAEFATLRPSFGPWRRPSADAPVMALSFAGDVPDVAERPVPRLPDDEDVVPQRPSDLPEITLATIMPAPLVMPPLPRPAVIELPAIAMAPITMAPIDIQTLPEEENP